MGARSQLLGPQPFGLQQHAVARQGEALRELQNLADLRPLAHYELPPGVAGEECADRRWIEARVVRHAGARELDRDIPLDGRRRVGCRFERARGLTLDRIATADQFPGKRSEEWRLERLAPRDDHPAAREGADLGEEARQRHLVAGGGVPGVLRIAPPAADRAALEPY